MELLTPSSVAQARAITRDFDQLLLDGFARVDDKGEQTLSAMVAAVRGTPLGQAAQRAAVSIANGEILAHHLAMLAGARAAIEGACFDALLDVVAGSRGLVVERPAPVPPSPTSPDVAALMEGARQWLVEVGLAGLGQLERSTVAPAVASLRHLQEHAPLRRLASLLTGFVHELLELVPTSALPEPPARRWADLWTSALLGTFALPGAPAARPVAGTLMPLGADVRHHDHQLSLVVHSLFIAAPDERRLVRTTLSAWKVDAITGDEQWQLLTAQAPELLDALVEPKRLEVSGATLLDGGDLRCDGSWVVGEPYEPTAVDLAGTILSAPLPRDRHPLALAVPVVLGAGSNLPVDFARISPHAQLSRDQIKTSPLVALIRHDDAFSLQPLAAFDEKGPRGPADGLRAKPKAAALDVLRERASKLLRAS